MHQNQQLGTIQDRAGNNPDVLLGERPLQHPRRHHHHHKVASHLAGLGQAHAHPETGGHAWGQGRGQRGAQTGVDGADASDHRLHHQLAAELLDAVDVLAHLPVEDKRHHSSGSITDVHILRARVPNANVRVRPHGFRY